MKVTLGGETTAVYPPLRTIDDSRAEWISKVNTIIGDEIIAGFTHTVDGTEYRFSYDIDDQMNFSQTTLSALLSMVNSVSTNDAGDSTGIVATPDKWRISWQGHKDNVSHTLELDMVTFINLANTGGNHIKSKLAEGWKLKAAISNATDEQALQEIITSNNLEIRYRDAYYNAVRRGDINSDTDTNRLELLANNTIYAAK